jgi:hypothetical protein
MNAKQINKVLDKAHRFTNDLLQEMIDTYPEDHAPYFLHVLLLQAAYGLKYYGFSIADIDDLIRTELGETKQLSFDHIMSLLPKPKSNAHEAWEFRWLHSEGEPRKLIYVDASEADRMIRATFSMGDTDGRGRVWLKRSEFNRIDNQDLLDFVQIIQQLHEISGLGVLVSPSAHKFIVESIGATEFFESLFVMIEKRHRPRNYDDPKYLSQESSNPYASSGTRTRGSRHDG